MKNSSSDRIREAFRSGKAIDMAMKRAALSVKKPMQPSSLASGKSSHAKKAVK